MSLSDYDAFYFNDDHIEEISGGSTTTHSDISLSEYDSFAFDLSNDQCPPTDRSDFAHEEFADELAHIISQPDTTTHSDISLSEYDSFIFDFAYEEFADELAYIIYPPEYDCFYFRNFLDSGELMSVLNSEICENLPSATSVNLPIEDDHSLLLAYVVWIFLAYLMYPVIPPYLHPFKNEDTIFDPGITINHFYSFKPRSSHRHGVSRNLILTAVT
nr:hypothetical protein [Tanacetum cinerariifolium]